MEYRSFGPTGLTVSALGLGCFDYPKPDREASGEDYVVGMIGNVNYAIDRGISCFHTAPHYGAGDSEIMLGRALGARRKDVVVVRERGARPPSPRPPVPPSISSFESLRTGSGRTAGLLSGPGVVFVSGMDGRPPNSRKTGSGRTRGDSRCACVAIRRVGAGILDSGSGAGMTSWGPE